MIELLYTASKLCLVAAVVLSLLRVVRGPSAYDRVLGLETVTLVLIGFLVLEARDARLRAYLDAALALALLGFIGTVAISLVLAESTSGDQPVAVDDHAARHGVRSFPGRAEADRSDQPDATGAPGGRGGGASSDPGGGRGGREVEDDA